MAYKLSNLNSQLNKNLKKKDDYIQKFLNNIQKQKKESDKIFERLDEWQEQREKNVYQIIKVAKKV